MIAWRVEREVLTERVRVVALALVAADVPSDLVTVLALREVADQLARTVDLTQPPAGMDALALVEPPHDRPH